MGYNNWYNKEYSSIKSFGSEFFRGVSEGSVYLRYPIHKVRRGVDVIDHAIQHGSKIPLLNDTLSLLTDNPLYAESLGFIHSIDKTFEDITHLAGDASTALRPTPYSNQNPNWRFSGGGAQHSFNNTYSIPFDAGFVSARQNIAGQRGEPQIEGAYDYATSFGRTNPPAQTSSSNHPTLTPSDHSAPAEATPLTPIEYYKPEGRIDVGYSSEFGGPTLSPTTIVPSRPGTVQRA